MDLKEFFKAAFKTAVGFALGMMIYDVALKPAVGKVKGMISSTPAKAG